MIDNSSKWIVRRLLLEDQDERAIENKFPAKDLTMFTQGFPIYNSFSLNKKLCDQSQQKSAKNGWL